MTPRVRLAVALLCLAAQAACAASWTQDRKIKGREVPTAAVSVEDRRVAYDAWRKDPKDKVYLYYFGTGGWLVGWRDQLIMTAPYFSNHGFTALSDFGLGRLLGDEAASPVAERVTRGLKNTAWDEANLILVGHGHVDHAGDLPKLFELEKKKFTVVANPTTLATLKAYEGEFTPVAIPREAPREPFTWPKDAEAPAYRVHPLRSDRAPDAVFGGAAVVPWHGSDEEPPKNASGKVTAPSKPGDWLDGDPYAFLIDLLDEEGRVRFRIHYMDSAASAPNAGIPNDSVRVDVHIGSTAGFQFTADYPEHIIDRTGARFVFGAHWEDFSKPQQATLHPVREPASSFERLAEFFTRVEDAHSAYAKKIKKPVGWLRPIGKSVEDCPSATCGPLAKGWALPLPGEGYVFPANAASAAAAEEAPPPGKAPPSKK